MDALSPLAPAASPVRSEFQTSLALCHLANSSEAFSRALQALGNHPVPADRAAGVRNQLRLILAATLKALEHPDLCTPIVFYSHHFTATKNQEPRTKNAPL